VRTNTVKVNIDDQWDILATVWDAIMEKDQNFHKPHPHPHSSVGEIQGALNGDILQRGFSPITPIIGVKGGRRNRSVMRERGVVGTRGTWSSKRDRAVRVVVRDPKSSQGEIVTPVERPRYHNLGKR